MLKSTMERCAATVLEVVRISAMSIKRSVQKDLDKIATALTGRNDCSSNGSVEYVTISKNRLCTPHISLSVGWVFQLVILSVGGRTHSMQ